MEDHANQMLELRETVPEILRALCMCEVDFIVAGGISAVLQGPPCSTFDPDIVHSREPGNVQHLLAACKELEATYRLRPERRLVPVARHLQSKRSSAAELCVGPGTRHQSANTRPRNAHSDKRGSWCAEGFSGVAGPSAHTGRALARRHLTTLSGGDLNQAAI